MIRLFFFLLSIVSLVHAADEPPPPPPAADPVPEVPDLPPPVESGETMEPDITIIRKGKETIQEYRRSGTLYMIKVIPDIGPPYYFYDYNGDGKMDVQGNDLDRGARVNMWKILEWD